MSPIKKFFKSNWAYIGMFVTIVLVCCLPFSLRNYYDANQSFNHYASTNYHRDMVLSPKQHIKLNHNRNIIKNDKTISGNKVKKLYHKDSVIKANLRNERFQRPIKDGIITKICTGSRWDTTFNDFIGFGYNMNEKQGYYLFLGNAILLIIILGILIIRYEEDCIKQSY